MPSFPNNPRVHAYIRFRKSGKSKQLSRMLADEYVEIHRIKQELEKPLTSLEASDAAHEIVQAKRIQKLLQKVNPRLNVSLPQASEIKGIYRSLFSYFNRSSNNRRRVPGREFSLGGVLDFYLAMRSEGAPHFKTTEQKLNFMLGVAEYYFGPRTPLDETTFRFSFRLRSPLAQFEQRVFTYHSVYSRAKAENTLGKVSVQQDALENNLYTSIEENLISVRVLRNKIRKLTAPLSINEEKSLRARIYHFDDRSNQKEIIRGERINRLGDWLARTSAQRIREFVVFDSNLKSKDDRENVAIHNWLLKALENPVNRKFLARKAIEWLGRGPSKSS